MLKRFCTLSTTMLIFSTGSIVADEIDSENKNSSIPASEKGQILLLSEAFGHFIGKNLHNPGIQFDLERFIKGIRDGAAGKAAPLSEEDYQQLLELYQEKAFTEFAQENLKDSNAFLKDNLDNLDVYEIEKDKLQYETPFGIFGKIFDYFLLKNHLTNFLLNRNNILKRIAEN